VDLAGRLAPDLAEVRIARGYLYYWGVGDYPRALDEFTAASRQQPGDGELLAAIGYVERRRGRWDSALARFQEAARSDPRSAVRALDLADTHMSLRSYAEAERAFDRAIQLAPDWAEPWAYKAMLQLVWHGDTARARGVTAQALTRVSLGRLAQAITAADAISAALLTADTAFSGALAAVTPASLDGDTARYHLLQAEAAAFRGDRAAERAHADSALPALEHRLRSRPDDAKLLVRIGLAYARAGRSAEALRAAERAAALLPPTRDANSGPFVLARQAQICMLAGEQARAFDILERLLALPGWLTPALLRSDPTWAPLRSHPRFARLASAA
jgi:tetratricopeptide (TPR) repeat protein